MKITLGNYIPGTSPVHRADPRTKIVWTVVMMVLILMCSTFYQYLLAAAFVVLTVAVARIPVKMLLKSLKPILFLLVFTVVFNLIFFKGDTLWVSWGFLKIYREAVMMSVKTVIRVCLLVISASVLTFTTTAVSITDGLERLMRPLAKIGFPAHSVAMMMFIALRFIPLFADETEQIIKAQSARGAEFESRNIIRKITSYVPVLVPLFVSAFRSAEDLAVAMEARCYRGGDGRTKFKVLRFSRYDLILAAFTLVFAAGLLGMKYGFRI